MAPSGAIRVFATGSRYRAEAAARIIAAQLT
jgi:hypothetical protein